MPKRWTGRKEGRREVRSESWRQSDERPSATRGGRTRLQEVRVDPRRRQDLIAFLARLARADADAAEAAGERLDLDDELDAAHAVGVPPEEGVRARLVDLDDDLCLVDRRGARSKEVSHGRHTQSSLEGDAPLPGRPPTRRASRR